MLDAEFALILLRRAHADEYVAARDPIGIRPLYYGRDARGAMVFASEPKNLTGHVRADICRSRRDVLLEGRATSCAIADPAACGQPSCRDDLDTVCKNIRGKLIAGVEKRLDGRRQGRLPALRRAGFLAGVRHRRAAGAAKPIRTFAIGMR